MDNENNTRNPALNPAGDDAGRLSRACYVEGDYMVETQEREDELFAQKAAYQAAQNIKDGDIYHFDTPCMVENQIKMFLQAVFSIAEKVWRNGNTTIIVGYK